MPQDYVVDVYLSVRLEAGSLHVANYLIRATFYYLYVKVILFPSSAKHSCTPSGKHLLLHGVIHHHPVASGNVIVDYKGLESTFGVPKSSPGPPGKGLTKCHLGLLLQNCWLNASFFCISGIIIIYYLCKKRYLWTGYTLRHRERRCWRG